MMLEFPSGAMAHVQMSWLDPHKERRLTVVGSEKMVVFDDMQNREKLKIYDKGVERPPEYSSYGESLSIREGDIEIPRIPNVEPLGAELRHFLAVASGTEESRAPAENGPAQRDSDRTARQICRSPRRRGWQTARASHPAGHRSNTTARGRQRQNRMKNPCRKSPRCRSARAAPSSCPKRCRYGWPCNDIHQSRRY